MHACDLIRSGTCGLVLAGGTDSLRTAMTATAFDRPDDAIDPDVVTKAPRPLTVPIALSVSSGFGGQNAAVVLTAA
ncbi:beta-ketoacyl synthase N-terminal-like domain-containing protein [Kitasatospora sp. NPDC001660]